MKITCYTVVPKRYYMKRNTLHAWVSSVLHVLSKTIAIELRSLVLLLDSFECVHSRQIFLLVLLWCILTLAKLYLHDVIERNILRWRC